MITIIVAQHFWQRLFGLIGKKSISREEGFFIPRCRRVHTWGMRFPIDVVFINGSNYVIAVVENLGPWKISAPIKNVWGCLELKAGGAREHGIVVGSCLVISNGRCRVSSAAQ